MNCGTGSIDTVSYCIECSSDTISFSKVHNIKQVFLLIVCIDTIVILFQMSPLFVPYYYHNNRISEKIDQLWINIHLYACSFQTNSYIINQQFVVYLFIAIDLLSIFNQYPSSCSPFSSEFSCVIVLVMDLFNDEWLKGGNASRSNADIYLL